MDIPFPDPRLADEHGLVALGGDFRPQLLVAAYARGIFPWPSREIHHAWFSPDPRMVLEPARFRPGRTLRKVIRRGGFSITFDLAFDAVIDACSTVPRSGMPGTWIVDELIQGFRELHRLGVAHSVETWRDGELVGGLYGISLGAMFTGESMFFREPNASKVALAALVDRVSGWRFRFIDCQVYTEHMARLGAREWRRDIFLDELDKALEVETRIGPWTDDARPEDGPPEGKLTRDLKPARDGGPA
ncbi:MAG: leucyl/phenylalanyl-tRNA--protein transferase [Acidobacteriota bacterium]